MLVFPNALVMAKLKFCPLAVLGSIVGIVKLIHLAI
jgi:hypothetical protein